MIDLQKTGVNFIPKIYSDKYYLRSSNFISNNTSCDIFLTDDELIDLCRQIEKQVEIINNNRLEDIADIPIDCINPFKDDKYRIIE